jgi:hypothetical protein
MSKTFRAWKIDEPLFLPPMVGDFVAKDHLARFVLSLVRDDLGLGEITGTYGSERGQPPFDPTMMTALLLYSLPIRFTHTSTSASRASHPN